MSTTMQRPATLTPNIDGMPIDPLFTRAQWVTWDWHTKAGRPGEWTKPPFRPIDGRHASHAKREDWGSRTEALAAMRERGHAGIGFVLTHDLGLVGLDFDKCRDPETGALAPWAAAWVARFASYAEVTPSGTGIRLFVRGTLPAYIPAGGTKKDNREVYAGLRFLTLTGHQLPGVPATVEERQDVIDAFLAENFPAPAPKPAHATVPPQPVSLDDEALIARACNANDGGAFERLWRGDTSDAGGDKSAADYRLAFRLAFWTQHDKARTERLMRASGMATPERLARWDDRRVDSTWLRRGCIDPAFTDQTEDYNPLTPHRVPTFTIGSIPTVNAAPPLPPCGEDDPLAAYRAMDHEALAQLAAEMAGALVARDQVIAEERRLRQRSQQTLTSVMQVRRNPHIKAERDTVLACAFDAMAEIACGRVDAEGWVRQPLGRVADAVGKGKRAVATHLERAEEWGLLERKLVSEEPVREIDQDTGEVRVHTTGAYYVRLKDDPEKIIDVLVTLQPTQVTEDGEDRASWGGRRDACPKCASQKVKKTVETKTVETTTVACDGCGHVYHTGVRQIGESETVVSFGDMSFDVPTMVDARKLSALRGRRTPEAAPASVAPVPVAVPATRAAYPPGEVIYQRAPSVPTPFPIAPDSILAKAARRSGYVDAGAAGGGDD